VDSINKFSLKDIAAAIKKAMNKGNKSLFGIDIGLSSVKVAEVTVKQGKTPKYTIQKYAYASLPEGCIIEDEIQKPDEIIKAITKALSLAGIDLTNCCLGLFGPNTVAKKLQLAGGSREEIEDQVMWESEQYLPFSIDESSIDFHIVGENEGGGVDIIVAAVKNDIRYNYGELLEQAGLNIKIYDLNLIAVTNVFEETRTEEELHGESSFLIMDIGAQNTSFIIYRNGVIQFSKEIGFGGVMITEEIQRRMGVNYYEAEDLKNNKDASGNQPEEIIEIIDDITDLLFAEVKKTLDFYIVSTSDESLSECYITGGAILGNGLHEGLESLLKVPVKILNPLDVFEINTKNFSDEQINNITFQGCSVLGLAMRVL
jgi:type IV pilus assembly protein PilM